MKKIVLGTMFLLIVLASHAQRVRIGMYASPAISWLKPDESTISRDGIRFGIEYGVLADIFVSSKSENYGITTGISVILNGGKVAYSDTLIIPVMANAAFRTQYLNIPILLKLQTNEIGYMTYFGHFGLTPGFRISARSDASVNGIQLYENESIIKKGNDTGIFRSNVFNVSLTVGGGVQYAINGKTSIVGGIYYNNGFISIVDDGDDEGIQVNSFVLRIGVLF